MIRLGYACINDELREKHVFTNRTCRLSSVREKGIDFAREIARMNLMDLLEVLKWNEAHGIRFFRISSDMFPHITNAALIAKSKRKNFKSLAYKLEDFETILKKIGKYARKHEHRLTFHPDQFVLLSASDQIILNSKRILWMHARIFDIMSMDLNSVMVIHGGGIYGDKEKTMAKWVATFDDLPIEIKRRLVIENDERSYNVLDIMNISRLVKPYMPWQNDLTNFKIPIVFDIFHYFCYGVELQPPIESILDEILSSWHLRRIKMHISEQKSGGTLGSHSDYVNKIPKILLNFPKKYGNLDLMVEAKKKEAAVELLRRKYKICI